MTLKDLVLVYNPEQFCTIGKYAPLFLRAIINIFFQGIFTNIITYLGRTFKAKQNDINFKIK
jgi:hypothetical protein